MDIYASILKALEKKEKACCIFLDFAKAFDTVNHEILLTKLEYYGLRGIAYELMKSYLSERLQCVKIRQTVSDVKKITCGVPQGSVLGTLLLLIYINDIYKSDPIAEFRLFADDTALFCANKNLNQLKNNINTSLDNIANWLKVNKLTLNVDKSKLLYFDLAPACKRDVFDVYINGKPLEFNSKAKYLGVTIDNKLTWHQHIENIKNKINKGIGILKKMCHFLQEDTLVSLFNDFVKLYVDYGSLTWGGTANTHLLKLERTLNKAVRIMAFRSKYKSAEPLFIYYKILPLEANIKLNQGKFIWKLTQNQNPDCIQAIYHTNLSTAINNKEGNNRFYFTIF